MGNQKVDDHRDLSRRLDRHDRLSERDVTRRPWLADHSYSSYRRGIPHEGHDANDAIVGKKLGLHVGCTIYVRGANAAGNKWHQDKVLRGSADHVQGIRETLECREFTHVSADVIAVIIHTDPIEQAQTIIYSWIAIFRDDRCQGKIRSIRILPDGVDRI